MDLRRLGAGEWIAALAGVGLLVSLFLPWYTAPRLTAWEALALTDVLLAVVAAGALAVLLITAAQRVPAVPLAADGLLTSAGLVAVVLVLVRLLWLPAEAGDRAAALWLGLAGALGIVVGGFLAMRDERLSKEG